MTTPDLDKARERYRRIAATYDRRTRIIDGARRRAIKRLSLEPGMTVADVGCGTGANFVGLLERVGDRGHVIGIEPSREMRALARERADADAARRVTLIAEPADRARLPERVDAILFSFTHDVLCTPAALQNLLSQTRPGAHVVAAGGMWAPWWALPVNAVVWFRSRRFITTFEGFGRPWTHLEAMVDGLTVERLLFGSLYVVSATARAQEAGRT